MFKGYLFFITSKFFFLLEKEYCLYLNFFKNRSIFFMFLSVSIIKTGLSFFIIFSKPFTTEYSCPFTSIFAKEILYLTFLIFLRFIDV